VPRLAGLLLFATACGGDTNELALELRDGGCTADVLEEIAILSIEVYGSNDGTMCALSRRCLFNVDMAIEGGPVQSLAALEDVLRDANQPLIDIESEGADYFKIVGRRNESGCWSGTSHPACGEADLADAEDGELPVTIRCEPCVEEDVPLCP
jgi:hypothetical protein